MASSMLTGDRRWAPTRKSGMTVLGKVPKPINLPSQRLENHGLDPNVEIVPKGTLTWGGRPSSATPNAWGSSNQSSPKTDGSVNSPSRLYGRPSSGGTRPSTAGSDRSVEPISNAWTSNSRPSSASGVLVSNQSSPVTRPRSAETRPGSSQLSRFADENTVSQSSGISERPEQVSSKDTNFTFSSGDFPTLGSKKNSELHVQQENNFQHGPPALASGTETEQKERSRVSSIGEEPVNNVSSDKEDANTWKLDTQPYASGGHPSIGNWQREPNMAQTSPNMNLQDYNAWRGPQVHNLPDGAWYRGVSPGGPYRPTGPPGSYPLKPFAYYPAQIPVGSASDSQSAPRAGAVLGGYPHKSGESFRSHCSTDTYATSAAPVIPGWSGVYPRPVPYDGYRGPYRPNMDKLSSGMTTGHGIYNQYQHQNALQEPGKFHSGTSGYVGSGVNQQHLEASHTHETHGGQYRVLLKQHDAHFNSNDSNEKREHPLVGNTPYLGSVSHQKDIMREDDSEGARNSEKVIETLECSSMSPASDCGSISQAGSTGKLHDISSKAREIDDFPKETSNHGITSIDSQQYPVKKNTKLIEKIEDLNNKVRIIDGHSEDPFAARRDYGRESRNEKIKVDKSTGLQKSHVISFKNSSNSTGKGSTLLVPDSNVVLETSMKGDNEEYANVEIIPHSSEVHPVIGSDPLDSGPRVHSHVPRNAHDMHSWAESHAKTRASISGRDEWRKQSSKNDSSFVDAINKKVSLSEACDQPVFQEFPSQKCSHGENKDGDKSHALSSMDPIDYHAQRAKMKEIAMQRAKQLQKEEEERIKEQKAKAHAKLEELNKRTSTESTNKNRNLVLQQNIVLHVPQISVDPVDHTTINCTKTADANFQPGCGESHESEGTHLLQKIETGAIRIEESVLYQTSDSGTTGHGISNQLEKNNTDKNDKPGVGLESVPSPDSGNNNLGHSTVSSPKIDDSDSIKDSQIISCNSSMPNDPSAPIFSTKSIQESGTTKQRQMGHRKKQSIQQKSFGDMPILPVDTDSCKGGNVSTDGALTNNSNETGENLTQNKKKNNRGFRPKQKLVDALHISNTSPASCSEGIPEKHVEGGTTMSSGLISEAVPIIDQISEENMKGQHSSDSIISSSQGLLQGADESRRQTVSQWRSHPPRRTARNSQPRLVEKIHGVEAVWAPVKPSSKSEPTGTSSNSEPTEGIANKGLEKVSDHSSTKNTNIAENNFKSKRAEMERYVPKVIAKELSRREGIHQPTDISQVVPSETTNFDHGNSLVEVTVENKNRDHGKPMKHGKSRTSWRKRSSHDGASSPNAVATSHQPVNEKQSTKLDSAFQQIVHSNDGSSVDNANVLPGDSDITPLGDKESANRVKHRGQKVDKIVSNYTISDTGQKVDKIVSNYTISDTGNLSRGSTKKLDVQPPAFGWSDLDTKSSRNESRNVVEHTRSQWKPKSQVHSSHTQEKGNRGTEIPVQNAITDDGSPLQIMGDRQMLNAENQSNISPDVLVPGTRNVNKHESRRESKSNNMESLKDKIVSQNQDSSHVAEQAPAIAEPHRGQGNGLRRYGQHNGRFNKGQEANHAGVRGLGLDSGKNNLPAKIDRPRHNSHYGYQKIESHDKTTDANQANVIESEDPKETFHAPGPGYRARGQNYPRRGGQLYVRNVGPSRNSDKHDIRE